MTNPPPKTPAERETARQLAYYQQLIDAEQGKSTSDITKMKAERAAEKLRQAQARAAAFQASPLAQQLVVPSEKTGLSKFTKTQLAVGALALASAGWLAYRKWGKK